MPSARWRCFTRTYLAGLALQPRRITSLVAGVFPCFMRARPSWGHGHGWPQPLPWRPILNIGATLTLSFLEAPTKSSGNANLVIRVLHGHARRGVHLIRAKPTRVLFGLQSAPGTAALSYHYLRYDIHRLEPRHRWRHAGLRLCASIWLCSAGVRSVNANRCSRHRRAMMTTTPHGVGRIPDRMTQLRRGRCPPPAGLGLMSGPGGAFELRVN